LNCEGRVSKRKAKEQGKEKLLRRNTSKKADRRGKKKKEEKSGTAKKNYDKARVFYQIIKPIAIGTGNKKKGSLLKVITKSKSLDL